MTKALTYVEIDIPPFVAELPSYYSLALRFEGADGATTTTDESTFHHTITFHASAQIDTAQFQSGVSSLLLNGSTDYITPGAGSGEFNLGTGDFTIDLYFRTTSVAGIQSLYIHDSGTDFQLYLSTNTVKFWAAGSDRISGSVIIATNTWYRASLIRQSGTTRLYINGVQDGSNYTDSNTYSPGATGPIIGTHSTISMQWFGGWLDNIRVLKGHADLTFANLDTEIPVVGGTETFRFTTDVEYLPSNIGAIPSIKDVKITPPTVSLGGDLGTRASVDVTFLDHKHIFASESFDSGTFWGKFRARYGLKLRGYPFRVIQGYVGQALIDMETRHYIIESTDGPSTKGEYKIIAKDVLKFADGDRAQAPPLSTGFLLADITNAQTYITLSPTGAGDASYRGAGYVAIGGNEIARYNRLGIDDFDVLLIHADGNSPGSIIDALSTPHTITVNGNATASATQSKFGGSSISFDGAGDFLTLDGSAEFAFGTGDFCVDFWVRFNSIAATQMLYDSRPTATSGNYLQILFALTGTKIRVTINSVDRIIGATNIVTNTWYHLAVTREGSIMRLFLNGVQDGSDTNSISFLNGASRPVIGADGVNTANNNFNGFIDELRVSKGAARFTATPFTVPSVPYSVAGSGNEMSITRAQYNTVASEHKANDRVQLCVEYLSMNVANIIYDLLTTYSDVDPSFITLANWTTETGTYLNTLYSALIAEPTAVSDLISELIEQASLVIWWDDLNEQVKLQVLRAVSTVSNIYNDDNIIMDSLTVKEQPDKRISQVYTYFGKINPLVNADQIDNYRSSAFAIDTAAETEYGSASIKKIFSRWIPFGGRSVANQVNTILLARFVTPPRRIGFNVMRYSGTPPALGLGYQIEGWPFQDTSGAPDSVPAQIVRLTPGPDKFEVELEEVFAGADAAPNSPDNHIILIDANTMNVNLRTMHDSIYPVATSGITINCTILAGVIIGSTSTANPAFDVGSWAAGVIINLTVLGRIEGMGGDGSTGGGPGHVNGFPGFNGGIALYTRQAIFLTDTSGQIWGGGGGGGGGSGTGGSIGGGGGGGGAGSNPGAGGGALGNGNRGQAGTTELGGEGGNEGGGGAGKGGAGGGPGLNGSAGVSAGAIGGAGGTAGKAIDGIASVTTVGGAGDRRGGTV